MDFYKQAIVGFLIVAATIAAPQGFNGACSGVSQRKAWHTLSNDQKLDYINAEICLMYLPAKMGFAGAKTRFDEFQAVHQMQSDIIHDVGAFLPFHRFFIHAHEYVMRTECGYTGSQPYWDEPRDAGAFRNSTVLDPVYGFGGDGGSDSCITDGPFAFYTNSIGPGYINTEHCIDRRINEVMSRDAAQQYVDECYEYQTFLTVWPCLEFRPHGGGHGGIGGQMLNPVSSPGDPIFYLHHAWLDKVWWEWQRKNIPARLTEIGGPNSVIRTSGLLQKPGSPTPVVGDPGNVTTLAHVLNMYSIIPDATISDVMDIQGGFLCYEYI